MKKSLLTALFAALFCALALPAPAADEGSGPGIIGTYDGWTAYHFMHDGKKVCFMSRSPDKQAGAFTKRGPVLLFVTRWSGEKDKNVVSLAAGFPFKDKSSALLAVDGKQFSLFTQGDMAWTKDDAVDDELIKKIRDGASMTIKSVSKRGTDITDTYSLKGSAEAYDAITGACAS